MNQLSDLLQESKPIDEVSTSSDNQSASNAKSPAPSASASTSQASGIVGLLASLPAKVSVLFQKAQNTASRATPKPASTDSTEAGPTTPEALLSHMKTPSAPNKKMLLIGVSILLIMGVVYLGSEVVKTLRTNGILPSDGIFGGGEPTPTLGEIAPTIPSIYALDSVVLQLEEDINTLDGQLSSTVLKENTLDPPKLDYDIRF